MLKGFSCSPKCDLYMQPPFLLVSVFFETCPVIDLTAHPKLLPPKTFQIAALTGDRSNLQLSRKSNCAVACESIATPLTLAGSYRRAATACIAACTRIDGPLAALTSYT